MTDSYTRKCNRYFIRDTQATVKVISGQDTIHPIFKYTLDSLPMTHVTLCWKKIGQNEAEQTGKAKIRWAEHLAVGEADKSIQSLTQGTFDSSGFSADGTIISASAEPPKQMNWKRREIIHKTLVLKLEWCLMRVAFC